MDHREERREYMRKWVQDPSVKAKRAAYNRQYTEENREANNTRQARWDRKNRVAIRAAQQKSRSSLSDSYVRGKLKAGFHGPIETIPPELIELKRAQLKLNRAWKAEEAR